MDGLAGIFILMVGGGALAASMVGIVMAIIMVTDTVTIMDIVVVLLQVITLAEEVHTIMFTETGLQAWFVQEHRDQPEI